MFQEKITLIQEDFVIDYSELCLAGLYIKPVMNVLPSTTVYEGDKVKVVCKVVNPPSSVDLSLIKNKILVTSAPFNLTHEFIAQDGDSGDLVCNAEWNNVVDDKNLTITVKGKYQIFSLSSVI